MEDPQRRYRICARVKRGLCDTGEHGAFRVDQAYFRGAVQILQHVDQIDFWMLYCGQIALEDMTKIYQKARRNCLRLPCFLDSPDKVKRYVAFFKIISFKNVEKSFFLFHSDSSSFLNFF